MSFSSDQNPICLGLIPARGGSKGIPGKNLAPLAGKPLLAHTCDAASQSRALSRTILSTDDEAIAEAGRSFGVEVPFLRPADLAGDASPTGPTVKHALDWLAEHEDFQPDIIVLLQPTAPLRTHHHIDEVIERLVTSGADSVVSVSPVPGHYNPHWQFEVTDGELTIFTGEEFGDLVTRRQELPPTYTRNGAVYAFKRETFLQTGSIYGDRVAAYEMDTGVSVNIDAPEDLQLAEIALARRDGGSTS